MRTLLTYSDTERSGRLYFSIDLFFLVHYFRDTIREHDKMVVGSMDTIRFQTIVAGIFLSLCLLSTTWAGAHVDVIEVNGVVNPVADKFISDAIKAAEDDGAQCLIIELDTPGGLMESMHSIKKNILASDVPVVVFVSPGGARAASAGVWITLASHIAAMTPGTHIGAAHPVAMGGKEMSEDVEQKLVNDAVADIRSLDFFWSIGMCRTGFHIYSIRRSLCLFERSVLPIDRIFMGLGHVLECSFRDYCGNRSHFFPLCLLFFPFE